MVGMACIDGLWKRRDFRSASRDKKIVLLEEEYEKAIEKQYQPEYKSNWDKSLPLVEKLVGLDFQSTYFLQTEVTYGAKKRAQIFNISEIKHNQEFVTLLLAIGSVWKSYFYTEIIRPMFSDNENVEKSVKLFLSRNPQYAEACQNYCLHKFTGGEYLVLRNYSFDDSLNGGGVNMRSETSVLEVICY